MVNIALSTFNEPDPAKTEILLLEPLARRGINADIVVWNDVHVEWEQFDAIVIGSTWDYHQKLSEFRAWLNYLGSKSKRLINHIDLLRWNTDKLYLNELSHLGIRTLETIFIRKKETVDLALLMEGKSWEKAIIKPTISAGGDNTHLIRFEDVASFQSLFNNMLETQGLMVQHYAPEIKRGEVSFIFFNGIYSHSVIKRPSPQSIFVHTHRGGTSQHYHPAPQLIAQASASLRAVKHITNHMPLYARVDGIIRSDVLYLLELELIEPELFLSIDADATERYADALTNAVVLSS